MTAAELEEVVVAEEEVAVVVDITAHLGGTASTANQLTRSASPAQHPLSVPRRASTPISNLGSLVG